MTRQGNFDKKIMKEESNGIELNAQRKTYVYQRDKRAFQNSDTRMDVNK